MSNIDKQQQQEKIIIKILTDDIIYSRIENSLFELHNVFNPSNKEALESEHTREYNGHSTALYIIGVDHTDDELMEKICRLTYKMKEENFERADVLAKKLYKCWLNEIANHFLTLKKTA